MDGYLTRARLLYEQSRYAQAEQELRNLLNETPHNAKAHALLAHCLAEQNKLDEAQAEAEQAIALAPDEAYPYDCRSFVLVYCGRHAQAEASAREAIRLDPTCPDYHAQLALALLQQRKWQEGCDAATMGLAHDPEHGGCIHLRTIALTWLGRQAEAAASVNSSLARDPDDAMAHANKGWALLHERKWNDALPHFRDALRIDPTCDYAQRGIVEALKARNSIYRWILAYFMYLTRLGDRARWRVFIGGLVAYFVAGRIADSYPPSAIWIVPLRWLYAAFALLFLFGYPLFNLLLRFNRFGWYALSPDQRTASNWFGACLALCITALTAGLIWDSELALLVAGYAIGMALPLVMIYYFDDHWPRKRMKVFTGAMAVLGGAALATSAVNLPQSTMLTVIFVFGFIATPVVAGYLRSASASR
jgi:tetratricopeptide (TPR) repeat protein